MKAHRLPLRPLMSLGLAIPCLALAVSIIAAMAANVAPQPALDPPLLPSPLTAFRLMLNTNTTGRTQALQNRPASQRRLLEAKLREYDALSPEVREQRLRATEFRYYLRPLLTLPSTNRQTHLAVIPESYRALLAQRLKRWDALPEDTRHDLLAYDQALSWLARNRLLTRVNATTPPPPPPPAAANSPLERQITRWQALPQTQRDALCRQFEEFFTLSNPAQERTLRSLSDQERRQVEDTLQAFHRLPPAERALCLHAFRKFAELSPADRADFLRSADRWREMSQLERNQWRQLVTKLPPLPPGFSSPPPLPPPSLSQAGGQGSLTTSTGQPAGE